MAIYDSVEKFWAGLVRANSVARRVEDIGGINIPEVYYHATPSGNVTSVLTLGLVPRGKSRFRGKEYTSRGKRRLVGRLFLSSSPEGAVAMARSMGTKRGRGGEWTLLSVCLPKGLEAREDVGLPLGESFYITEAIPPSSIRVVGEI